MKLVDIQTLSYEKAEIIEEREGIALARIHDLTGSDPGNYFEILRKVPGEGGKPVYIMNLARPGLHEPYAGAAKVPFPLDRMREGFNQMVAELVNKRTIKERATAEASEKERAAELKTAKLATAGQIQREAKAELKALISVAGDVKKLADDKKLHKLLMRIASTEQIISQLKSKE